MTDAVELTEEEITALKSLAAIADKLSALVSSNTTDTDEEIETDDEDIDTDEEVLDTDEETDKELAKTGACDSKRAFGSKESRKKAMIDDSVDRNEKISQAWSKRGIKGGR